jgi:hypothetical protein
MLDLLFGIQFNIAPNAWTIDMNRIKFLLIHLADMFDYWVLGHRFYWVCKMLGNNWWGDDGLVCGCRYCKWTRGQDCADIPEECIRKNYFPKHTGQ